MAFDRKRKRLLVAALGSGTLEVVNLRTRKVTSVGGLNEPQGVAYDDADDLIFVANGGSGECQVFDGRLKKIDTVRVGEDADNVRYVALRHTVLVGYGEGGLAEIGSATRKVTHRTELGAHPESFQMDPASNRIFVNLPGRREVAVLDGPSRQITARWPLPGVRSNFPMAVASTGEVLVGCREPARLLVLDSHTGRVNAQADLSSDVDDLFVEGSRVFAVCGEGFVDQFEIQKTSMKRVSHTATSAGARTGLYVKELHQLFIAFPARDGHEAGILILKV